MTLAFRGSLEQSNGEQCDRQWLHGQNSQGWLQNFFLYDLQCQPLPQVWNAESGTCVHTLYGHTSTVRCMHLHSTKVVSGSRDATLRMWDVEVSIQPLTTLSIIAPSPDWRMFACVGWPRGGGEVCSV